VIWGSQRVWTKDHPKRLGRTRTPIHVYVGEPIDVPRPVDQAGVTETLRARMSSLLDQAQAAYPAPPPEDEGPRWWLPARLGGTAPTPQEAARLDEEERVRRARGRTEDP
ncbi:MAG: 1-acyl-sn-glycerol-3-phosphate acyltransferase, partial [Actinomycetes bacterium]